MKKMIMEQGWGKNSKKNTQKKNNMKTAGVGSEKGQKKSKGQD